MTPDVLLGLDPEQREAAEAVTGPVCILAGAGTGKTRTITHRAAHAVLTGQVEPSALMLVTFTARAAGEMRSRLRTLGVPGVQARTFHASALRQLQYFYPRSVGGELPRVEASKIGLVGQAAARLRMKTDAATLRDLASEIEWAKATLTTPESYPVRADAHGRTPPVAPGEVVRLMRAYEEVKARAEVLDFDDLLLLMAGLIEDDPRVADQFRRQYRHFVVDEYQDVTPLQQRLLDAWLGTSHELCVVGDAAQTIYSFTGASPDPLLTFTSRFPDATVVRLERDYRSTPQVVAAANTVLRSATDLPPAARLKLVGQRPDGPAPAFLDCEDEVAEARQVALRISRLLDGGTPASEIAVLYRINAQSQAFEDALSGADIPYVVKGGERFFQRKEVREAIMLLRGATRAADHGLPDGLEAQVLHVLDGRFDLSATPAAGSQARDRWDALAALVQLGTTLAAERPEATLQDLVVELDDRAQHQHAPSVDGVTLATLHAAKGLEWDAVFLIGLVEGTLPLIHATSDAAVAEERRLLYVGVTRAREHLTLSWARARTPGGRGNRKRSRFLDVLAPASAASRVVVKTARPVDSDLEPAQQVLLDKLKDWRGRSAVAQGKPAYVIFKDDTLRALVRAAPASTLELGRVSGVGPAKLQQYGEAVLGVLAGQDVPATVPERSEPTSV